MEEYRAVNKNEILDLPWRFKKDVYCAAESPFGTAGPGFHSCPPMWRKEFSYSKSHQLKNSAVKAIREKLESPPARTPTSAPPTLTWEDIFNGPLTVATVAGSRTEVILDAKQEPLLINAEGRGAFALTRAPAAHRPPLPSHPPQYMVFGG